MQIELDISEKLEAALREEWGDLSVAAKEALAIESYRTGRISLGFLAEILGMGVLQADAWLAKRGVPLNYSQADLQSDLCDLSSVLGAPAEANGRSFQESSPSC